MATHLHRSWGPPAPEESIAMFPGTDDFVRALRKWDPDPATWDDRVLRLIEHHLQAEQDAIDAYEGMRQEADEAISYIVGLMMQDEERHHRLLSHLHSSIDRIAGHMNHAEEIPMLAPLAADRRRRLLTATRRLLDIEREDARGLRDMAHDLKSVSARSLWPVVVEALLADTEKHERILHRIEQMLTA